MLRGLPARPRAGAADRWRTLTDGLPGPFWALLAGTFVTKAGAFVAPMMFVYLTQVRGVPATTAGLVASAFGVGSFLGTLSGGVLADRVGRRVTMLGSLVLGAGTLLALGSATHVGAIGALAFLLGLTADAYRPASQALVADLVAPEHRVKAFGIQYWAINLGFAVAASVGGAFAEHHFRWLFVGDAATTLVLALVVFLAVPETRPVAVSSPAGAPAAPAGSLLTPVLDPRFAPLLLLNVVVLLVFFQHLTGIPADMAAKGLPTSWFGYAIAVNGVVIVFVQPIVLRAVTTARRSRVLALASVLTGLGFGMTTLATSLPTYMLSVAVWTLGEVLFAPVNAALVADLAPPALRGRYQGAYGMTWSFGAAVAPVVGPWIAVHAGLPALWGLSLGLCLVVAAAHLLWTPRVLGEV